MKTIIQKIEQLKKEVTELSAHGAKYDVPLDKKLWDIVYAKNQLILKYTKELDKIIHVYVTDVNADLACDTVEEFLTDNARIEDFVPFMYNEGYDMTIFEDDK